MKMDPLDAALRNVAETKHLLELVVTSSESFDYRNAKVALKQLQRKIRDLSKLQAEFQALQKIRNPNVQLLNFRTASVDSLKQQ